MTGPRGFIERYYLALVLVVRMVNCGATTADRVIERIAESRDQCGGHDD